MVHGRYSWFGRRSAAPVSCIAASAWLLGGCGGADTTELRERWSLVAESPEAALLSVHGSSADDVWMVGADLGDGPLVLHWDGSSWERKATGLGGDLWWVQRHTDGTVYMSGSDANVLRYRDGLFERMHTPGLGKDVVFGVWANAADDVYAVGTSQGRNGFIWHYDGESFRELPLPADLPLDEKADVPGFFKVWGRAGDDVWVVGARGTVLHGDATRGFELVAAGGEEALFTVHGDEREVAIVGGDASGVLLEDEGAGLTPTIVPGAGLLQGVWLASDRTLYTVGIGGRVFERTPEQRGWSEIGGDYPVQSLHSVWVDPDGGVWTVGGNVLTNRLDDGVGLYRAPGTAESTIAGIVTRYEPALDAGECPPAQIDPAPEASIARRWNEQLLGAIRRDIPRPTVHARNLFHASVAMWDAWVAYGGQGLPYLNDEHPPAPQNLDDARREAISYAAYRVLSHRYARATGGARSQACFDAFMSRLGYDAADKSSADDSARAVGNRIGARVIAEYANDGANEANDYADPDQYQPENPRLVVDLPGTGTIDPLKWQQLELAESVTQNGIPQGASPGYVGPHWGAVTPFALVRDVPGEPYISGANPPTALDDQLIAAVVQVIQRTAQLDINDGVTWDISPGAYGNNPLASDENPGHALNPVTGEPYAPERVLRGDFTRVLAEFWADGPASETPPGHWNALANGVSYDPRFERRAFGSGPVLDALSWDVQLYLALNGALHDAAIAAWELKRRYVSARPITLVRYLGGLGQRTDPSGPSYHPDGLPLVDNLIEVITEESSRPGARHAHLARYRGEIAVRCWRGEPGDRDHDIGGVGWIRAREWIPYQRRFFVTPAFPGYVSGHSTFSRAAAVVLHQLTGSAFFPGGLGSYRVEPGYLFFEYGPSAGFELQWATYYDAADQAGQSRLYGGIHIVNDDFDGRRTGAKVGELAVERARHYYEATP
jgi:hypothetical protein